MSIVQERFKTEAGFAVNQYITVEELADVLNIGRSTAYTIVKQPGFPVVRVGKLIRIPYGKLEEWLNGQLQN